MLPIRTSIRPRRTPYVNYLLIGLNVLAFSSQFTVDPYTQQAMYRPWVGTCMLVPDQWRAWQFLTYAFLHANFLHIFGNMFFLYIFGNNVNDKLGHLGYACFYLAGAVFSGLGHVLVHHSSHVPILGASGAVAAVTGAYLVLFPKTLITVLYWFIFIGTFDLPALWFIGLKMILFDNYLGRSEDNVAYDAHIAGYAFGMGMMTLCLATGWIKGSHLDLWYLLRQWNRRRRYREAVSDGYDPYAVSPAGRKPIQSKVLDPSPEQAEKEARIQALRREIQIRLMERNLFAAADAYVALSAVDPEQVLSVQAQLEIANQLAGHGRHAQAAGAYELFLRHYPTYEHAEQVCLMLGLLYSRYLDRPQQAVPHLQRAAQGLSDPDQLGMCRAELTRLGADPKTN